MTKSHLPRRRTGVRILLLVVLIVYLGAVVLSVAKIAQREVFLPGDLADANDGKFFLYNSSQIYYETYPSLTNPPRGTIVFVHGFAGNLRNWQHQIQLFRDDYDLFLIDLMGFGLSQDIAHDAILGNDNQARMLSEFLTTMQLQNVILVGHSMGGGVALRVSLDNSMLVSAIVLVDSVDLGGNLDLSSLGWLNSPLLAQMPVGLTFDENAIEATLVSAVFDDSKLRSHIESYASPFKIKNSTANLVRHAFGKTSERNNELVELKQPVLIIYGEEDTWINPEIRTRLSDLIPQQETAIISQAGHNPQLEDPIAFNQVLLHWLDAQGEAL